MTDDARVHPSVDDPFVEAVSESVGGPMGEHAGRHPWWTPVRVVLALTAICFALGMLQKQPCYEDSWQDGDKRYTAMCYSDLPYLYTGRGFAELYWPYSDDPQVRRRYETMEYPVGISYFAWGAAWVTHWVAGAPDVGERAAMPRDDLFGKPDVAKEVRLYVAVSAALMALCALLAAYFLTGVNPRRPWDAAAFALSPALLFSGLVNWDLIAVAMVAGALWAWARDKPTLTGVMIGLGTATKLYPLFLLGGILIICLRRHLSPDRRLATEARALRSWLFAPNPTIGAVIGLGVAAVFVDRQFVLYWAVPLCMLGWVILVSARLLRPGDFELVTVSAAVAWYVANAPAYLSSKEQWKVFWHFNSDRGADLGSAWLVAQQWTEKTIEIDTINKVSWAFFIGWCVVGLLIGLAAPQTPRLAQLGFLVVAGFLLINKVYSPQYVLWLLPLAVLARPRWRDLLIWQAGEVFYFACVWWYLGGYLAPSSGGEPGFYWIAVLVRILCELWLVGVVVRDILRPSYDVVDRDAKVVSSPRPSLAST